MRDGAPRVCVSRAPEGARFETTVGAQSAIDQTIVADAVSRPVNDAECSGTQRAEWSKSGLRLFSSAEIRCKGDDGLRRVSGLSLIAPNGDWLDIQTVAIGPRETIRVKRYYRADDSPRSTRPTVVSSRLTLDEVKDASAKVSSAALEAALVETNAGFDLSKKAVTDLASAGVSGRVIDLMVALSYPDKFAIQAVGQGGRSPRADRRWFRLPGTYLRPVLLRLRIALSLRTVRIPGIYLCGRRSRRRRRRCFRGAATERRARDQRPGLHAHRAA